MSGSSAAHAARAASVRMSTAPAFGTLVRDRHSWGQLARYGLVGAGGYGVNLAVFALCTAGGAGHRAAAVAAFLVAVTSNFLLNRRWTFRAQLGPVRRQAGRFLAVSVLAFVVSLGVLELLVRGGLAPVLAQATAIVAVTPVSYLGNRAWSFQP